MRPLVEHWGGIFWRQESLHSNTRGKIDYWWNPSSDRRKKYFMIAISQTVISLIYFETVGTKRWWFQAKRHPLFHWKGINSLILQLAVSKRIKTLIMFDLATFAQLILNLQCTNLTKKRTNNTLFTICSTLNLPIWFTKIVCCSTVSTLF